MNNDTLYATGIQLWNDWTEMWNGRPELALDLVAEKFALHLPSPATFDVASVDNPAAVAKWVAAHRANYDKLTFHSPSGAFVDVRAGIVAGPWYADTIVKGVVRPVCGMDTIAFKNGKITEYWTISKEVDAVGAWCTRA